MVLQSVNGQYQTGNIMGFFGLGDERLTVASRFCEADLFLQYLLAKVMDFPTILNSPADASQDDRLFDFLIFLFPSYLRAALRKGPFKKYVNVRHNDDRLRGTINVSRHIRENTPFIGTVAYDQRELSYDNDLMELIRHTVEYVKGRQYGRPLLANVRDEVRLVVAATPGYRLSERQKEERQEPRSSRLLPRIPHTAEALPSHPPPQKAPDRQRSSSNLRRARRWCVAMGGVSQHAHWGMVPPPQKQEPARSPVSVLWQHWADISRLHW